MEHFGQAAYPIGIDLGATGAKLAQVAPGRSGLRVVAMSRIELPAGAADESARLDQMIRAVARRVHGGGFEGSRCVLSVDDRLLRVRSVRLPKMPDGDTGKAVHMDGPARLGFADESECVLGWMRAAEVAQSDGVKEEILYVGAAMAPLEQVALGLAELGLEPVAIEPGFIAAARCYGRQLRRQADQSVVRVLVDVGLRGSSVMITRGHRVAFYKAVDLGGEEMTRAASEKLGLDPEAVSALRRQRMTRSADTPIDPKIDRAMFDAVRPLLGDLAHEVNLCTRHYSVTFRGGRPTECIAFGGDALEPHLARILSETLQIPATVADPLDGIAMPEGVDRRPAAMRPEYAVAVGLSLLPIESRSQGRARAARRGVDPEPARGPETGRAAA
jgi:type IV pilus assembly protein PilM